MILFSCKYTLTENVIAFIDATEMIIGWVS